MNQTQQGFTLIELLIVIAIIGVLAAVLIPNLLGARKRAYDTNAMTCGKSIQTVQGVFQIDSRRHFEITKTSGTAAAPTITDTAATSPIADMSAYTDDLNEGCSAAEIEINTTSADGTGYEIIVLDTRGSQTYTVTASSVTNARQ